MNSWLQTVTNVYGRLLVVVTPSGEQSYRGRQQWLTCGRPALLSRVVTAFTTFETLRCIFALMFFLLMFTYFSFTFSCGYICINLSELVVSVRYIIIPCHLESFPAELHHHHHHHYR